MTQRSDLRITRARVLPATGDSPKMIGNNSRLASHGAQTRDPVLLLETADGLTGIGRVRGPVEEELPGVLGHSAWEFWKEPAEGAVLDARCSVPGSDRTGQEGAVLGARCPVPGSDADPACPVLSEPGTGHWAPGTAPSCPVLSEPSTEHRAPGTAPSMGVTLTACEFAIWDLIAKARGVPVYALLGGTPGAVDVYDGGLYFCDLLFPDRPIERIREEAAESVGRGFRQIKMKVGRGHKWMEPEAGFRRDVEAVAAVRETVGPDVLLMVDGNNGFDRAGAIRFFREIGPLNIYWAEEMFPETIEDCRAFRDFLRESGWATLIADGETQRSVEPMLPIMEQGLIEVQQLDIKTIGLTEWLRVAEICRQYGCKLSPHTWSSQIGMFHSLHLGRAMPHFLTAEVPAYNVDALLPAGIAWHGGQYHLGEMPGWGLVVNERVCSEKYAEAAWQEHA